MADDVQGLIVLREGDRFATIGRTGRARLWSIDLSGEPSEEVDRTGVAPEVPWQLDPTGDRATLRNPLGTVVCEDHHAEQHRDGRGPWCDTCGRSDQGVPRDAMPSVVTGG